MYICEVVSSNRNKNKINIHGYLMVKDKNRQTSYYWYCEKRNTLQCSGRATTILTEDQHYLVKVTEHNHAAEASRVEVAKNIKLLKERAQQTNDQTTQVIQSIAAYSLQEVCQCLPSYDALHQTVKRIQCIDLSAELTSLESLIIPEYMRKTLNGLEFLVRDTTVGNERVLIFLTFDNIAYLAQSPFWIMDGTFKTVSTIFT